MHTPNNTNKQTLNSSHLKADAQITHLMQTFQVAFNIFRIQISQDNYKDHSKKNAEEFE